jgi:lantibiotic leader peptide-processing serine protease
MKAVGIATNPGSKGESEMRKALFAAVALAAVSLTAASAVRTEAGSDMRPTRFVILHEANASPAAVRAAVTQAGGRILRANNEVGVATAISAKSTFLARAVASPAIQGVARNMPIGTARPMLRPKLTVEMQRSLRNAAKAMSRGQHQRSGKRAHHHGGLQPEPFADLQWDMKMIHATVEGSYRKEQGSKKVRVGIIDTGVDGNHPDIKPNFDRKLSRNFTTDIPLIDGPCGVEPDHSCSDSNDVDENSHGTHVASTIGSPINGIGIAGVAPHVTLVNLRAGQDSGFFFVQPSVDALTYAGDHGIDVVNMSYFIDPWLFNCRSNPADTPEQQEEQATIIEATQRALDYAHDRNVTLIAAAGNEHTNLAQVTSDDTSPDFPPGTEYHRTIDNNCLSMPEQGNNVLGVSAVGPSKNKADYSNYGYEKITVSAPGGWFRDDPWTPGAATEVGVPNLILAAYPKNVAEELGDIDANGDPTNPFVLKSCKGQKCGYYQYLQGTSMASPHAVGVAALIISRYGKGRHGKVSLHPFLTQAYLQASATRTPCMTPNPFSYANKGRPPEFDTFCEGTPVYNGVYGYGIVDALRAVSGDVLH